MGIIPYSGSVKIRIVHWGNRHVSNQGRLVIKYAEVFEPKHSPARGGFFRLPEGQEHGATLDAFGTCNRRAIGPIVNRNRFKFVGFDIVATGLLSEKQTHTIRVLPNRFNQVFQVVS
jgi:hypothetical protein